MCIRDSTTLALRCAAAEERAPPEAGHPGRRDALLGLQEAQGPRRSPSSLPRPPCCGPPC
eukprot:7557874-Alexandrium_andersonii.AAC.1